MSYYKAKSLKIDKKNNKISGVMADSCWRDFENKMIYDKFDNMYGDFNTIGDKIACLYHDIICGGIHTSISKYADLVCSFDYFKDFCDEFKAVRYKENRQDDELYGVYLKYQDDFKKYTTKNCILRTKEKRYGSFYEYVRKETNTHYFTTRDKEKAKKYNDIRVKEREWYMENFEIEYI